MPRFLLAAVAGVITLGLWPVGAYQQNPEVRATISGRVVDALTRRPLAHAVVQLVTVGDTPRDGDEGVEAGPDGRFVLSNVAAGVYDLKATMTILTGWYGQVTATGAPAALRVAPGAAVRDIEVPIWPAAVISGTVYDDRGDPAVFTDVAAYRYAYALGDSSAVGATASALTDGTGRYEIVVSPGTHVVMARMAGDIPGLYGVLFDGETVYPNLRHGPVPPPAAASGARREYVTTFAPSSTRVDEAEMVTIGAGERRGGVDVHLQAVSFTTVSGRVSFPPGPDGVADVALEPVDARSHVAFAGARTITTTGEFVLRVRPGNYFLTAHRSRWLSHGTMPDDSGWGLKVPITVGEERIQDLSYSMTQGSPLTGRITIVGGGPIPDRSTVFFDGQGFRFLTIGSDGRINTEGVLPGTYKLQVHVRGHTVTRVTSNGLDITDGPLVVGGSAPVQLEISLTSRPPSLKGRVSSNAVPRDLTVMLFPVAYANWTPADRNGHRFRDVAVQWDGTYELTDLLDGTYFVAVIDNERLDNRASQTFWDEIASRAHRVSFAEGTATVLDLTHRIR